MRTYLQQLQEAGLLIVKRRGLGKTKSRKSEKTQPTEQELIQRYREAAERANANWERLLDPDA